MPYYSFSPDQLSTSDLHQHIIGAISPRPIAFVSTLNKEGDSNLAPYSFFNALSSNPPIIAFSSNLRPGPSSEKDTLLNIKETKSCVINLVNFDMIHQCALASVEFSFGVSEFDKTGLTPIKSDVIKPFRVKESPVQIECTVLDIIALGKQVGAANLIICEIKKMHIKESVMDAQLRRIDPQKLDLVGRLGRSNYVRVKGDNIISLYQSTKPDCIGYDRLPSTIKKSRFFTGNDLGRFAALSKLPIQEVILVNMKNMFIKKDMDIEYYHRHAKQLLVDDEVEKAIIVAMIPEIIL